MLHQVRALAQKWLTNWEKKPKKAFKRWNNKAKRTTGFEDRAGNL